MGSSEAAQPAESAGTVSIVLVALDEAQALPRTLASVRALDPAPREVLLVDGGSRDDTVRLASAAGIRVLHSPAPGRAVQMNLGAHACRGEIVCFLHADTWLPPDAVQVMQQTLANPRVALAGFVSLMTGSRKTRWLTSLHNTVKTIYAPLFFRPIGFFRNHLRLLFGDQVMFCRRSQFLAAGGFDPKQVVMEEADLCIKLSRMGQVVQLSRTVWSSDRRVARWGFFRSHARFVTIAVLWGFGVPARLLKRWYEDVR